MNPDATTTTTTTTEFSIHESSDAAQPRIETQRTGRVAITTPIGVLMLEGNDRALTGIELPESRARKGRFSPSGRSTRSDQMESTSARSKKTLPGAVFESVRQLEEYFDGDRKEFDLPLELSGSAFQKDVWLSLAQIPYGETVSYAELAMMVGRPTAFRAVGQANGANPIPIVLPCHRVIASGGTLGGYGGGLETKRRLLTLEGAYWKE